MRNLYRIYNSYSWKNLEQTNELDNLNLLDVASCNGYGQLRESRLETGTVRPVFRNIEQELIKQIKSHTIIIGCVAWLTSVPILKALQGKEVSFVVQQEDWLRPDSSDWTMKEQRKLYASLNGISNWYAEVSVCWYGELSPIRLSGKPKNNNRNNARMHHKFLLFGNEPGEGTDTFDLLWTGSYNITNNATKSLENGLFISDKTIIEEYFNEYRQVLLSSFRIEEKWWDESYGWNCDDEDIRDGT